MVEALLKKVLAKRANKLPSFVLIVGDEESDDHMFEVYMGRPTGEISIPYSRVYHIRASW